jgi:hypothetical protein
VFERSGLDKVVMARIRKERTRTTGVYRRRNERGVVVYVVKRGSLTSVWRGGRKEEEEERDEEEKQRRKTQKGKGGGTGCSALRVAEGEEPRAEEGEEAVEDDVAAGRRRNAGGRTEQEGRSKG